MMRGRDDGIVEAVALEVEASVPDEVATTILDCGVNDVAASVPVGLMLSGADDVVPLR